MKSFLAKRAQSFRAKRAQKQLYASGHEVAESKPVVLLMEGGYDAKPMVDGLCQVIDAIAFRLRIIFCEKKESGNTN